MAEQPNSTALLIRRLGVEDADGRAWCFECAHAEIRDAGDAVFMVDLYAWSARRKCVNCRRPVGEGAP